MNIYQDITQSIKEAYVQNANAWNFPDKAKRFIVSNRSFRGGYDDFERWMYITEFDSIANKVVDFESLCYLIEQLLGRSESLNMGNGHDRKVFFAFFRAIDFDIREKYLEGKTGYGHLDSVKTVLDKHLKIFGDDMEMFPIAQI